MAGRRHLVVFTRFPEPHTTKTRLIPVLGPEGAAALQRHMTRRILRWAGLLQSELGLSVEVRFAGGDDQKMRECFGATFLYRPQGHGDLGSRMLRAAEDGFRQGAERTVIIGTDCPGITPQLALTAFDRLLDHPLVLGPALDGGYYLIGMRRPIPELFRDMHWGSSQVLADTLRRANGLDLSVSQLETLSDVDRPEDLDVWRQASQVGV
jgi:uncharacterized protein